MVIDLGVEWWDYVVILYLIFEEKPTFLKQLQQFIYIISNTLSAPVFPQPKEQSCSYYRYIEVWNTDSLVMYDVQFYMVPTFNAMVTATYHSAKIMSPKHTDQGYIFENPSIIYINICKLLFSIIIRLSSIFLSTTLIVRHKYCYNRGIFPGHLADGRSQTTKLIESFPLPQY